MTNITGTIPFGSLTAKNVHTVNFESFDLNNDGIITEEELESVLDKEVFDSIDLSSMDKNADIKVTKEEYELWQQEAEIKNLTDNIKQQVAKDFVGHDKDDILKVLDALEEYKNSFIEKYSSNNKDKSKMASAYKKDLPAKYIEIKRFALQNTKSAIKSRVIENVISEVILSNQNGEKTFSGLISEVNNGFSDNAKRLLGNELSKIADKFIKNYDGDELEPALQNHLIQFLKSTDRSKLSDAINLWEKGKEELSKLPGEIALRQLKEKAKNFLMSAIEQNIPISLGNVSVRSTVAIMPALAQFQDIESLRNAINKIIANLSNKSTVENIINPEQNNNNVNDLDEMFKFNNTSNIFK